MIQKLKRDINKWIIFPDVLSTKKFGGYFTKDDITQIQGYFPIGQNIKFTDTPNPTLRDGFNPIGTESSAQTPIKRAWRFERRDGVEIEMRAYDTKMEYRVNGTMSSFLLLKGGFTAAKLFSFCVISRTINTVSYVYFCNGIEDWYKWTGVYGLYASDNGSNQITIQGTTTLSTLGFTATGTIIINGIEITYTGLSNQTFTGCSAMPIGVVIGDIIAQSPVAASLTSVEGSVAFVHDGRIHARLETKQAVSNYSKLDNPDDWTAGSNDGDGGAKEIEEGGPIIAYGHDEKTLYIFKKRIIKTLQFIASGSKVDVPIYSTLKPSDDKSTTVGATGLKSTFHSPNGIIFITEDKEMLHLTRQANVDYPQLISISDQIKPTMQVGIHDEASGIVYQGKVFYAYKQDGNSTYNDVVIIYDIIRQIWYLPIVGWNVNDWTIINNKLHWHSSINPNSYEVIDDKLDNNLPFTSILRTHSENFNYPYYTKNIWAIYVEIFMTENTAITLDVLYDQDGYSGTESFTLSGSDSNNLLQAGEYNPFGVNPFGTERFGSNADLSGMKRYKYIVYLKGNVEFYDIAIQFTTQEVGNNYELIRYGYFLESIYQEFNKKIIKSIT